MKTSDELLNVLRGANGWDIAGSRAHSRSVEGSDWDFITSNEEVWARFVHANGFTYGSEENMYGAYNDRNTKAVATLTVDGIKIDLILVESLQARKIADRMVYAIRDAACIPKDNAIIRRLYDIVYENLKT